MLQVVPVVAGSREGGRSTELQSVADIPASVESLSVADMAKCVLLLGLSQREADAVAKHGVDGPQLMKLTISQLTEQLNFTPLDASKLARFARGWRPT